MLGTTFNRRRLALLAALPRGSATAFKYSSRFQLLIAIAVASCAASVSAFAQGRPLGTFDWKSTDAGPPLVGEYLFSANGTVSFVIRKPPIRASLKWRMVGDRVVMDSLDGGQQTYRWEGPDLVLVDSSAPMPKERIVLKKRRP